MRKRRLVKDGEWGRECVCVWGGEVLQNIEGRGVVIRDTRVSDVQSVTIETKQ